MRQISSQQPISVFKPANVDSPANHISIRVVSYITGDDRWLIFPIRFLPGWHFWDTFPDRKSISNIRNCPSPWLNVFQQKLSLCWVSKFFLLETEFENDVCSTWHLTCQVEHAPKFAVVSPALHWRVLSVSASVLVKFYFSWSDVL